MNMMATTTLSRDLTVYEEDALALASAALEIAAAFEAKDDKRLAAALNHNLQLWVGIRTLVSRPTSPLPSGVKDNLIRLSNFVARKTFDMQNGANAKVINALTNTNLQISEGLLERRSA
jgi:flagellar biosynthesis regulator FlaF